MLGALVCALTIVTHSLKWDPLTIGFLIIFMAGMLSGWLFNRISDRKVRDEVAAGYTTVTRGHNEVQRVHSGTGVIMRHAGRPNLTKPEWEEAMFRVRAFQASVNDNANET
jgi:hypothetical protein